MKLKTFLLISLGCRGLFAAEAKKDPIFNGFLAWNMCHTNDYAAFLGGEGPYVPFKFQLAVIKWTDEGAFKQPMVVRIEDQYNQSIYSSPATGIQCKSDRIEILFPIDRNRQYFSVLPYRITNSIVALPIELTHIPFKYKSSPYLGVNVPDEEGAKENHQQVPPEFRGDNISDLEYAVGEHVLTIFSRPDIGGILLLVKVNSPDPNYQVDVHLVRLAKDRKETDNLHVVSGSWMEPSD